MKEKMKLLAEDHINRVNDYLDKIYTIERPEDYQKSKAPTINVRTELLEVSNFIDFYSAIEKGEQEGALYETYSKYLNGLRDELKILLREDAKIREGYIKEIDNAKVLINNFEKYL